MTPSEGISALRKTSVCQNPLRQTLFLTEPIGKISGEQRNVIDPLRERRYVNPDHVQPVIKILSDWAAPLFIFEIEVGRSKHASVYVNRRLCRPYTFDVSIFQHTKQFSLDAKVDFADFIEEQSPCIRLFEFPLVLRRASRSRISRIFSSAFRTATRSLSALTGFSRTS